MSSRLFAHYAFEAHETFGRFEDSLRLAKISFVRACVYRSNAEQNALYQQGRTTPGHIVTWAKPGHSKHNRMAGDLPASHAGDYYPLVNGKLAGKRPHSHFLLWQRMGALAVAAGLEWGGNWKSKKADFPHFQFRGAK